MPSLGTLTVKVDTTMIEPVLEKLFGRIEELQKENEELKDRITDLEGLPLHG